jgi:site-specific recombinase XerD
MAWFSRRNGRLYLYFSENGKPRQVPVHLTRHLEGASDQEVKSWADYHESETKRTVKAPPPMTNERITKSVDEFCTYLLSRGRDPSTVSHHRSSLLNSVVPYFLSKNIEDVHAWPSASVKMLAALQERGLSHHQITKCNIATSLYWKWLTEEGLVHSTINLRKPVNVKSHTPLQNTLTPEQVWEWLDRPELDPESLAHEPEIKLMCVLGYFFSLRPQEVFALRKKTFVAGKLAKEIECGKVMAEHGLFPALAVKVTQQITRSGREKLPKAGSGGWVACFDKECLW